MWGTRAQGMTLAGLAIGGTLIASIALAQEPQNPFAGECNRTATPEEVEGARGAHQAARQFYDRAEYERAIQYWRDVFKFDCNAIGTLINLANAYEKLGDRQNAIFALETYIKRSLQADPTVNVSKYEAKVENLKQLQKAQTDAAASAAASAAPPTSATTPPPPPPPPPPPMGKPYGLAPNIPIFGGGAMLIGGLIVHAVGTGKVSAVQDRCDEVVTDTVWSCKEQTDVDEARTGQTMALTGKIVAGVGLTTMVGGFIWQFAFNKPVPMEADKPATGRIRISPTFGPSGSGAMIHGTF
jgi:hypothetical protein